MKQCIRIFLLMSVVVLPVTCFCQRVKVSGNARPNTDTLKFEFLKVCIDNKTNSTLELDANGHFVLDSLSAGIHTIDFYLNKVFCPVRIKEKRFFEDTDLGDLIFYPDEYQYMEEWGEIEKAVPYFDRFPIPSPSGDSLFEVYTREFQRFNPNYRVELTSIDTDQDTTDYIYLRRQYFLLKAKEKP